MLTRLPHRAAAAAVTVVAASALAGAANTGVALASPSIGAGISAAPVVLDRPARPGRTYSLPPVLVKNTGNTTARYRVALVPSPLPRSRGVQRRWVTFSSNDVLLRPGQTRRVRLRLRVPRSARSGYYSGLIYVSAYRRVRGGNRVGAAAATRLLFGVARRGGNR